MALLVAHLSVPNSLDVQHRQRGIKQRQPLPPAAPQQHKSWSMAGVVQLETH
jgi:hypothetical protein